MCRMCEIIKEEVHQLSKEAGEHRVICVCGNLLGARPIRNGEEPVTMMNLFGECCAERLPHGMEPYVGNIKVDKPGDNDPRVAEWDRRALERGDRRK